MNGILQQLPVAAAPSLTVSDVDSHLWSLFVDYWRKPAGYWRTTPGHLLTEEAYFAAAVLVAEKFVLEPD